MFTFQEDFDHRWCASHPWALIDASWRDELPAHWPVSIIAPAFLGEDTGRCPVLLNVHALPDAEQSSFFDQLLAHASAREDTLASLLLSSNADPATLQTHLADRLAIRLAGQGGPKQFRYFDSNTFLQLPRVLGERGMSWLLGPVGSALVPWAGQWSELARPADPALHFRLQAVHIGGLSRIGAVNRAALQMPPPASPAAWIESCRRIDALCNAAWTPGRCRMWKTSPHSRSTPWRTTPHSIPIRCSSVCSKNCAPPSLKTSWTTANSARV